MKDSGIANHMDGAITKILEVKILAYLLGFLQVYGKRITAGILWRKRFGVIRRDVTATTITLLLAFLAERFNPLGHESLSPIKRFQFR